LFEDELVKGSLGDMMKPFFVSPVFDFFAGSQRFDNDLFSGLAKGQDQEDLQVFRQFESRPEFFAIDKSNDAAPKASLDGSQEDALGVPARILDKPPR
jgi:hypothetical protein